MQSASAPQYEGLLFCSYKKLMKYSYVIKSFYMVKDAYIPVAHRVQSVCNRVQNEAKIYTQI